MNHNQATTFYLNGSKEQKNCFTKKVVSDLCSQNFVSFEGYQKTISKSLGIKHNIPIYISQSLLLFHLGGVRNYETIWVNYFSILGIQALESGQSMIVFLNSQTIIVEKSVKRIQKDLKKCEIILKCKKP